MAKSSPPGGDPRHDPEFQRRQRALGLEGDTTISPRLRSYNFGFAFLHTRSTRRFLICALSLGKPFILYKTNDLAQAEEKLKYFANPISGRKLWLIDQHYGSVTTKEEYGQ